jgi:DsbC/DsbD-like thiol-disulfide interchange protein
MLRFAGLMFAGLVLNAAAIAQAPVKPKSAFGADTVSWSVSVPKEDVKPGAKIKLAVKGTVVEGWHIYALEQGARGPIPLSVDVEKNAVAVAAGALIAAPPVKAHDKSFGFETQYYDKDFTIEVPVQIDAKSATGAQQIPVIVYYQSCNGKVCHPPRSVTLLAPVNVKAR